MRSMITFDTQLKIALTSSHVKVPGNKLKFHFLYREVMWWNVKLMKSDVSQTEFSEVALAEESTLNS